VERLLKNRVPSAYNYIFGEHVKRLFLLGVLLLPMLVFSQTKKLRKSQHSSLKQTIGYTDVAVEYSRPNLNGRSLFTSFVPYNKVWRTGANFCTTLELSNDINVQGKHLKKGTYSLYTIPNKDKWTIIINKKLSWGTQYTASEDVLRFEVSSVKSKEVLETFTIQFNNLKQHSGTLILAWSNIRVPITIRTDV